MNDYILVNDGSRVALTTRDYLHLKSDSPIWRKYVEGESSPFDFDSVLRQRLMALNWVDLTKVDKECETSVLRVYRVNLADYSVFNFYVKSNLRNELLAQFWLVGDKVARVSEVLSNVVFTPHKIYTDWQYLYRQSVLDRTGFEHDTWMYQVWLVVHELYTQGRTDDALEVMLCAIARCESENNSDALNKFRIAKDTLWR